MYRIIVIGLAALVGGYLAGLFGGMLLINLLSSNTHDKSLEAAMTSAFVIGPLAAIAALIATLFIVLRS